MQRIAVFLSIHLLSIGFIMAQPAFEEGYIINLANDTISGHISFKGDLKKLESFRFKSDLKEEAKVYSTDEIQAFKINGGSYYVSMPIEIDGQKEVLFIEKLLEGVIDLYYFSEKGAGFYVVVTEDGQRYELKNSQIKVETKNGSYLKNRKEYIYVLRYLFKDSPDILSQVDNLKFEPNAIIKITQEYHNEVCKDYECILYSKDNIKMQFDFGLYSGLAISKMRPESDYFKKMNNDFKCNNSFLVGLFMNVMDPSVSENLSLQLDVIFQNGKYVYETSNYDMSYLKIPLSVKYTFAGKKIRPAVQLGFAYNKWLKYDSENIILSHIDGDAYQKRTHQFGLLAGAEVSYSISDKFSLFLLYRYEIYTGKPWNQYIIPDYNGLPHVIPESVKTTTSFSTFSLGFRF